MASKVDRINLMYIFLSMSEALVSKHYQENLHLENKLSIHPPVDSHHSKSILRCACFCVTCNGCNCFSFNSQAEMCRLYLSCDPSDGTVAEDGWRSYSNTSLQPVTSLSFSGVCLSFNPMFVFFDLSNCNTIIKFILSISIVHTI